MKNKYLFLILAALTLNSAVFTGCSSKDEEQTAVTTAAPNNYAAQSTDTTVTGEVTAISGNVVTLALGTVSESSADAADAENVQTPPAQNGEAAQMPEMNGEKPDFANGEKPEMNGEKPDFANGEMPDFADGERRKPSAKIEKSGEEVTYTIPVGMTIDGLSGRSSDYSAITVGTVLTLTISEDGIVRAASAE